MMDWLLALFVILPNNEQAIREISKAEPQQSPIECNKLKLDEEFSQIPITYTQLTGRYSKLVCVGVPKTRIKA